MKILEDLGFIRTNKVNGHYRYVLVVHPTTAIQRLREQNRIPEDWWNVYRTRQIETHETSCETGKNEDPEGSVLVPMPTPAQTSKKKTG
jgi:hypothetical protein